MYQKHFDLGKTRSTTTDYVRLLEKQQWMSVIALIMLLTIDIA